ncbi:hypothetical protein BBJ28_00005198 [Nothophytophthora sp. Chile5]|nr:hypothetical protein BBJ28_00005198 [Nothophytophthora sp. Chile5]
MVALALGSCAGAAVEQQDTTAADVATVGESAPSDGLASKTDTVPEFVATADWQELLPGQGVPRTGKREAKLVDPDEEGTEEATRSVVVDPTAKKETTVTVTTDISGDIVAEEGMDDSLTVTEESIREDSDVSSSSEGGENAEEGAEPNWNHEKIVEVLQALPEPPKVEGMDIHDAHAKLPPAEFRQQIITLWKKRQAELKEAIASLQDDAKYLAKLLEQFQDAEQKGDTAGQLSVLEVLEWEVQDLDKTHVFNFIGGFGIMAEYLNSTNLPVRAHASWLVGTAAKNYKDGQEWAIDAGSVPKLIASLGLEVPSAGEGSEALEQAANDVLEAKKKALYALSSLVRVNKRGQRLFLLHNGPEFLAGLLSSSAHPAKLQMKVRSALTMVAHALSRH